MNYTKSTVTEISLPSNPGYLARLRRIIGCLADCAGMNSREVDDAKLAISEACANAIRHGSPAGSADKVTVRVSSSLGTVVTEVTDAGAGFDPADIVSKRTVSPGGLGIPLMKALTDSIEFMQSSQGMTVRLVKHARGNIKGRRHIAEPR